MISESASFHTAIFDALCACLNLNRNSTAAAALIHEAYAEPENTPRPPRNRNAIYWTVLQDPAPDPAATTYGTEGGAGRNTTVVYTTLKYQLIIVCYGPATRRKVPSGGSVWTWRSSSASGTNSVPRRGGQLQLLRLLSFIEAEKLPLSV